MKTSKSILCLVNFVHIGSVWMTPPVIDKTKNMALKWQKQESNYWLGWMNFKKYANTLFFTDGGTKIGDTFM